MNRHCQECDVWGPYDVCKVCGSPTVASACSGADARQEDELGPQKQPASVGRIEAQRKATEAELRAVSPRSGDGPAWLSEYLSSLEEACEKQVGLFKSGGDRYYDGVADGLDIAITVLHALLKQGHS